MRSEAIHSMPRPVTVEFKKHKIPYEAETSSASSSSLLGSEYKAAHTASINTLAKLCVRKDAYPLAVALRNPSNANTDDK